MSAVILNFRCPTARIISPHALPALSYCNVRGENGLWVEDLGLGRALGYSDPLAAVEAIYAQYQGELRALSMTAFPDDSEAYGRPRLRIFTLQGAMRLCEISGTTHAALLYSKISAVALQQFASAVDSAPKADVFPLPLPKSVKIRRVKIRAHHA